MRFTQTGEREGRRFKTGSSIIILGGDMPEKKRVCMICGKPSETSICDSCKAQIQGEALDKKQRIEREVRINIDIEKEKKKK
jgi:hypothetical protein